CRHLLRSRCFQAATGRSAIYTLSLHDALPIFTGGEPLVRRGFLDLLEAVSRHLGQGLDEITLTTNGVQLADFAEDLARIGVERVDRKSTRLNSSHVKISYAVFCLKKKNHDVTD